MAWSEFVIECLSGQTNVLLQVCKLKLISYCAWFSPSPMKLQNQTSWVLSSMAALYWRVKGQGKRAIDCLRQALNYAPHHMKASGSTADPPVTPPEERYQQENNCFSPRSFNQDVPLISLANIFQNARLWEDALTVARMAVEIAPHFVVNHFTLANVYVTMVMATVSTVLEPVF